MCKRAVFAMLVTLALAASAYAQGSFYIFRSPDSYNPVTGSLTPGATYGWYSGYDPYPRYYSPYRSYYPTYYGPYGTPYRAWTW